MTPQARGLAIFFGENIAGKPAKGTVYFTDSNPNGDIGTVKQVTSSNAGYTVTTIAGSVKPTKQKQAIALGTNSAFFGGSGSIAFDRFNRLWFSVATVSAVRDSIMYIDLNKNYVADATKFDYQVNTIAEGTGATGTKDGVQPSLMNSVDSKPTFETVLGLAFDTQGDLIVVS
jgi:hypothetical protein